MKFSSIKNRKIKFSFSLKEKHFKALKFIVHNQSLPLNIRWKASLLLSEMGVFSQTKISNKCFKTGRSRGFIRFTGLSRIQMRELGRDGKLPFIRKASW